MGPSLYDTIVVIIDILFYILLLAFALHAFFVAYHWFTYGTSRHISLVALAAYLGGGAVLFLVYSIAQGLV